MTYSESAQRTLSTIANKKLTMRILNELFSPKGLTMIQSIWLNKLFDHQINCCLNFEQNRIEQMEVFLFLRIYFAQVVFKVNNGLSLRIRAEDIDMIIMNESKYLKHKRGMTLMVIFKIIVSKLHSASEYSALYYYFANLFLHLFSAKKLLNCLLPILYAPWFQITSEIIHNVCCRVTFCG